MGAGDGGGGMQGKKEGRGRKRRYLQSGCGEKEPSLNSIIHCAIIISASDKYSHILYKYTIIEESIIIESLLKATRSRA